jgi:hypothetical protein
MQAAVDMANHLKSWLTVDLTQRWQDRQTYILKYVLRCRERQAMLSLIDSIEPPQNVWTPL